MVKLLLIFVCYFALAAAQTQQLNGAGKSEVGVQGASEGGGTVSEQLSPPASIKKDLRVEAPRAPLEVHPHALDEAVPDDDDEHVIVISEKTLAQLEAEARRKAATEASIAAKKNKAKEKESIAELATSAPPLIEARKKAATEASAAAKTNKPKEKESIAELATSAPPLHEKADTAAAGHQQVHAQESSFKQKFRHMDNTDMDLDSFQTGFYFFVGLSCAAILFIVFKVYRLRLSRAERKYGVQGDRSTQELTPLPITIEDGNSDEDDQTLFEINRQQIRIL